MKTKDEDGPDVVIMSLRLKSGRFEGSVEIPLDCTPQERDTFIDSWLLMMNAGLKCGPSRRKKETEA